MHFVLYKEWVLKNGSLGPTVSMKFFPCNCRYLKLLMKLLDGILECKVCNCVV